MPIRRTRSCLPPISTSMVSPSMTRSTTASDGSAGVAGGAQPATAANASGSQNLTRSFYSSAVTVAGAPPVVATRCQTLRASVCNREASGRTESAPGGWWRASVGSLVVSQFVDECQLNVRGGDGGAGCVSFRREGPVTMGGPNGGDGGKGGDVWLVADRNVASQLSFKDHPHRRAQDGVHGKGKDQHGRRGEPLEVMVPEGTVAYDLYSGELMADLVNDGDRWLAAAGGRGGRGNAKFLSNRRRAPSFAEQGEHGEERWLRLELKLVADVALVGFPNAGKSTFISRISAAKPKIADYPFTTLEPHLGVVRTDDTEFVVADIPGLIEGASQGRGLGDRFLRHVERASVLAVLIDLAPADARPPDEQLDVLLCELESYRPELLERPRYVVGTKADVAAPDVPWAGSRLSAVTGQGVAEAVRTLAGLVAEARAKVADTDTAAMVIHRPTPEGVHVERAGDGEFRVVGRAAERAVALSDLNAPGALAYVDRRLKRLGVARALARAGAAPGDVVHVGDFSFTYEPDL